MAAVAVLMAASLPLTGCGCSRGASDGDATDGVVADGTSFEDPGVLRELPEGEVDFDYYSVDLPDGWRPSAYGQSDMFVKDGSDGTIYVSVMGLKADELVSSEVSAEGSRYERRGDVKAKTGLVYACAYDREYGRGVYAADWEEGCVVVRTEGVGDADLTEFLDMFKPAEGAWEAWQESIS